MARTIIRVAPQWPIGACHTAARAPFRMVDGVLRAHITLTGRRAVMAGRAVDTAGARRDLLERQIETCTRGTGRKDTAAVTRHRETATPGRHESPTTVTDQQLDVRSNMHVQATGPILITDPQRATAGQAQATVVRCGPIALRPKAFNAAVSASSLLASRSAQEANIYLAVATRRRILVAGRVSATDTRAEEGILAVTPGDTPAANIATEATVA